MDYLVYEDGRLAAKGGDLVAQPGQRKPSDAELKKLMKANPSDFIEHQVWGPGVLQEDGTVQAELLRSIPVELMTEAEKKTFDKKVAAIKAESAKRE